MTKTVLVTNDDGIDGPGLRQLVTSLVARGYEPKIVAPDSDYSGAGTSIISRTGSNFTGTAREIKYERRELPEAPGAEAWAIDAPPAMCVLLAMRGAFGDRCDLVASGINFGLNTGGAVRHSGTVSAALTAAAFDVPAVAVSAAFDMANEDAEMRYDTAAEVAMQLLGLIADSNHKVLNINVPQCSVEELAGIAPASISQISRYQSYVESREDGFLKMGYRVLDVEVEPGSDTALVIAGYAAVSSLVGPTAIDCADIVNQVPRAAA